MSKTRFKTLNISLTETDYKQAKLFSDIQMLCLSFLEKHNILQRSFINFINTEVNHDYYIWHISTMALKKHISQKNNIKIEIWGDKFDIKKILNIINKKSSLKSDIDYVQNYSCNRHHIKIQNRVYDIRTALTKLTPQLNWNFLFSVEKAKVRKNDTILLYCIGNKNKIDKIVFSGTILHTIIRQCSILRKGQSTVFGTINRIDNYVTLLNKHYLY